MASQGFTEDLKHVLRDSVAGVRERIGELHRTLRSALGRLSALPRPVRMKIGACAAGVALLAGALPLRGEARPLTHRPLVRTSSPVTLDGSLPARSSSKRDLAGSSDDAHGQYPPAP